MDELVTTLGARGIELLRRHDLLRPLLEKTTVAEAVGPVTLEEEEREAALRHFCGQRSQQEWLETIGKNQGWTEAELEWQALLPLRVQRYSEEHFGHKTEARFLERKPQLDQVVYSLLRLKDGALAQELYFRIADGEATFAELAQQYSEGPERNSGGVVGPKPLIQAHPQLAERLRTSAEGQLIEPFPLLSWWLVARVERHLPARFSPQIADQMARELFQEWVSEQTADKLRQLLQSMAAAGPHAA